MFRFPITLLNIIFSLQIPFYIWLLFCKLSRRKVYSFVLLTSGLLIAIGLFQTFFFNYNHVQNDLITSWETFFWIVILRVVIISAFIFPLVFYVIYELMHRPKIEGIDNSNSSINTWEQHLRAISVYIIALCAWLGVLMYSLFNTLAWLPSGKVSILIALTILCLCLSILVRDRIKSRDESFHIIFIILDLILIFSVYYVVI
jgi:hypothetical protein